MSKVLKDQSTSVAYKIEIDNKDDFLKWFETIQIHSQWVALHSQNYLSHIKWIQFENQETKAIICAGIKSYSKDNDSSDIISKIHKQFKLSQLLNSKSKKTGETNYNDCSLLQNDVFVIQYLMCHVIYFNIWI